MKKNARFGVVALAIAGVIALGFYAYSANRAPANAPGSAPASPVNPGAAGGAPGGGIAVEVAKVKSSDFSDEASAVGNLKSAESVVLRPETAGRVSVINFKDGTIVSKGT
ncbi:MAG TPA: efflux transporter periplasmic adaptor subunit, partial [Azonexus sp.]|nr:efflux transporter periplasmic adaptor subunit [Azonexus sp.]